MARKRDNDKTTKNVIDAETKCLDFFGHVINLERLRQQSQLRSVECGRNDENLNYIICYLQ